MTVRKANGPGPFNRCRVGEFAGLECWDLEGKRLEGICNGLGTNVLYALFQIPYGRTNEGRMRLRRATIIAAVVAAVLLVGGTFLVLSTTGFPGGDDGTDGQSNGVDSKNSTVPAPFPVDVPSGAQIALGLNYPGKGNDSSVHDRNEYVRFNISAVPVPGYTGNVLMKVFVERVNGTVAGAVLVKDPQGKMIELTLNRDGNGPYDVLSGDVNSWKSTGAAVASSFEVLFSLSGDYNVTVQAFDLDTGKAISAPVTASIAVRSST
jgi:hypothetical protein